MEPKNPGQGCSGGASEACRQTSGSTSKADVSPDCEDGANEPLLTTAGRDVEQAGSFQPSVGIDPILLVKEDDEARRKHKDEDSPSSGSVSDDAKQPTLRALVKSVVQEFVGGSASLHRVNDIEPLLRGLVHICVWDPVSDRFSSGSGFLASADLGLVVTAAHVIFGPEQGRCQVGPYIFVGVVREADCRCSTFQYLAQVVGRDSKNKDDLSILRICLSLKKEVKSRSDFSALHAEFGPFSLIGQHGSSAEALKSLKADGLRSLKTTTSFALGEDVKIFGFNQGDCGIVPRGGIAGVICRSVNVSKGYIGRFKRGDDCIYFDFSSGSQSDYVILADEIVIIGSPVIRGDSGGPCINNKGEVIGIVSRRSEEPTRCYLTPIERVLPVLERVLSYLRNE